MRRRIFSFLISLLFCLLAAPPVPGVPPPQAPRFPLRNRTRSGYRSNTRAMPGCSSPRFPPPPPRTLPRSIPPCRSLK